MRVVAFAVGLSAYFNIMADSFMQHPVGARFNEATGRAELDNIFTLLTNPTAFAAFLHAYLGSLLLAGTLVAGISGWWMVRAARSEKHGSLLRGAQEGGAINMWRPTLRVGLWVTIFAIVTVTATGHVQAQMMFQQQPMKMASAEALCHTHEDPKFSVLSFSTLNNCETAVQLIGVPFVLSVLSQSQLTGVTLQGITEIQHQGEQLYGRGNCTPKLFVTYWSFRAMIGFHARVHPACRLRPVVYPTGPPIHEPDFRYLQPDRGADAVPV